MKRLWITLFQCFLGKFSSYYITIHIFEYYSFLNTGPIKHCINVFVTLGPTQPNYNFPGTLHTFCVCWDCWTSVVPAFQSWFAVEYSSCFISVRNHDLYVRCLIHLWMEVHHADRTMCIWTTAEPKVRLLQRKTGLSVPPPPRPPPPVIYYWPFQGDVSVVVYSNC